MLVPYSWLKEYCATKTDPHTLGETFRMTSSETDSVVYAGENLKDLVVGEIISAIKHPNADRLRVCEVNVGKSVKTIVCGAPNARCGIKVVVALPGVTIYPIKGEPFTLAKAKIRGIESNGMLCAAEEIGLALDSTGILELPDSVQAGSSVSKAIDLDDYILDVEITPNRPDLLSIIGLAREISTIEKRHLNLPEIYTKIDDTDRGKNPISITNEIPKSCKRYSACVLENVDVKPSPLWLSSKLLKAGVRPINCIVDATNYVLLEMGQPMHAFDLKKLVGKDITIRSGKKGESINAIDHTVRHIEQGDILITNQGSPIAIGGIMGGSESEVDQNTNFIILESATFHGPQIRKTSRRLGLRTEASSRFEKGLDPENTITALKRCIQIITDICPEAKVSGQIIDLYPGQKKERERIHVSFAQIQEITGVSISASECKTILQHLGFQIPMMNKSSFDCIPPTFRADVKITEDVIEELVRIFGYDRVPYTLNSGTICPPYPNLVFETKKAIRTGLSSEGLNETLHLSFVSEDLLKKVNLNPANHIKILVPLSKETEYICSTKLPLLLDNIATTNRDLTELELFEIGKVFCKPESEIANCKNQEKEVISLLIRSGISIENLVRRIKYILSRLAWELDINEFEYSIQSKNNQQLSSYATISCRGEEIGYFGVISDQLINNFKIRSGKSVIFAELDFDKIQNIPKQHRGFEPVSIYPSIIRDITVVVKDEVAFSDIHDQIIKGLSGSFIYKTEVMNEIFRKDKDNKAITYRLTFNAKDRTLQDEEISQTIEKLEKHLAKSEIKLSN